MEVQWIGADIAIYGARRDKSVSLLAEFHETASHIH
jgi:hypothetical protein